MVAELLDMVVSRGEVGCPVGERLHARRRRRRCVRACVHFFGAKRRPNLGSSCLAPWLPMLAVPNCCWPCTWPWLAVRCCCSAGRALLLLSAVHCC